jgi:hypothetical protein
MGDTLWRLSLPTLDAYLKEWQELSKRLTAQMSPALEAQEALRKSIQPIIETQNSLQKALEPILAQQEILKKLAESVQIPRFGIPDLSRFAIQATDFQRSIQQLVAPAFKQLHKTFLELPLRTREALLLLGAQGWYLDLEMPIPGLWQLKDALAEGNVTEAEEALIEYFESRLSEIEKSITERFPHRGHLVRAAFNAHRRQEYELSIPVLLAQTDGICKEVVNQYLFMKQNKRPRTAIYVEQIAADSYTAALLSPLAQTLPISASEGERPEDSNALNRHTVLHGESLNYGSKVNSLKAISLINYVAHVLEKQEGNP